MKHTSIIQALQNMQILSTIEAVSKLSKVCPRGNVWSAGRERSRGRSVANVSNVTFDMNGASSHILLPKWCRTCVEMVMDVCRNGVERAVCRNTVITRLTLCVAQSVEALEAGTQL